MTHDDDVQAAEIAARISASFSSMTLRELSDWVAANNRNMFDSGEFPAVDDLTDAEEAAARDEYESLADQILHGA